MNFLDTNDLQGDPTQRLLTCLGRFQHAVSAAYESETGEWAPEASEHLETAQTIADEQGWGTHLRMLTDTREILRACDGAGNAALAVPFLKEAYEIMCVAVGDLIVGQPSTRVRRKYESWHAEVRSELESSGVRISELEPWPEDKVHTRPGGCLTLLLAGISLGLSYIR